jgi:hypothetical protein
MKLGDDGNQMQADGNFFPAFILRWTGEAKFHARKSSRSNG